MCQNYLRVEGDEESLITHSLHTMLKCTDAVKAEKTLLSSIKLKPSCRESSKLLIKPDGAYQASSQLNLKITKSLLFDSSKFTLSTIHTYSPQHKPVITPWLVLTIAGCAIFWADVAAPKKDIAVGRPVADK